MVAEYTLSLFFIIICILFLLTVYILFLLTIDILLLLTVYILLLLTIYVLLLLTINTLLVITCHLLFMISIISLFLYNILLHISLPIPFQTLYMMIITLLLTLRHTPIRIFNKTEWIITEWTIPTLSIHNPTIILLIIITIHNIPTLPTILHTTSHNINHTFIILIIITINTIILLVP